MGRAAAGTVGAGRSRDTAFTGLEAALILIAFVVVAAVFSYTVLNTGFMVTQKSQSVIFRAVEQSTSTLEIPGTIYGIGDESSTTEIYKINFSCGVPLSGSPVDFEKVVLTYSNSSWLETLDRDPATFNPSGCVKGSGTWAVYRKTPDLGRTDNKLDPGERFSISACPSQPILGDRSFTLEVKPAIGVALSITRTVPREVRPVNSLH